MAVIGTFGSFTAARLGIYASQSSLNVTGNNIANINTKGYTRQRMDLYSLNSMGSPRYANSFNVDIGYGVLSHSVSQLRDPYLDILYRNEQASVGAYEARLDGLKQLSHILDEVGDGDGEFGILEAQFNDLKRQLQILSLNAGGEEYDTTVQGAADKLCKYFNNYAKSLAKAKDTLTENLKGDVGSVNTILTQIRDLNVQIREAGIHGDSALELRDARNVLIDDLSSYIKIDVRYSLEKVDEYKDVEKLTISIADTGTPPIELINGIYGTQLSMPEEAAKRNPDYDPSQPTACRYIHQDSTPGNIKYTNELRYAMRMPGGKPVTNDLNGEAYLRPNGFPTGIAMANFYDENGTQPTTGKYLIVNPDGTTTGTDDESKATLVDNAKVGSDNNRLWMQLAPLKDERGRYMKDQNYQDITEPVDLGDNTLYGSLQSMREILVEEGEFASEEDLKFDEDANIKRGIPYYQHALDALAKKFAEIMNEANSNYVRKLDANGNPEFEKDDQGNQILDNNGKPIPVMVYEKVFQGYEVETDSEGVKRYKVNQDSQAYKDMMDEVQADPVLKDWEAYVTRVDLTDVKDPAVQNQIRELQNKYFPIKKTVGTDEEPLRPGDADGLAGVPIFNGGVLFSNRGDGDDTAKITAANISISNSWATGANRILNTKVPDMIHHTTDNDNIRHMLTLMGEDMNYTPQDINEIIPDKKDHAASDKVYFKGTFQDMLTNFNSILAADQNTTQTNYNSYSTKALARDNDRSSVSGVDLNEEATSMMQFQKSYAAACQLLTTLDSMLDKLINGTI